MRRAAAAGMGMSRLLAVLFAFSVAFPVEKLHPLQFGAFRLKYRRDRRPGLPIDPVLVVLSQTSLGDRAQSMGGWRRNGSSEPDVRAGTPRAKAQSLHRSRHDSGHREETETLEMFTHNAGARDQVAHVRKVDALTHSKQAAVGREEEVARWRST